MELHVVDPPPDRSLLENENFTLEQDTLGNWYFVNKHDHKIIRANNFIGDDVIFELYAPQNPDSPQNLILNDEQVLKISHFNPKLPTRILIHGFNSKGNMMEKFTKTYFSKGHFNFNFIGVNWEKGSNIPSYLQVLIFYTSCSRFDFCAFYIYIGSGN